MAVRQASRRSSASAAGSARTPSDLFGQKRPDGAELFPDDAAGGGQHRRGSRRRAQLFESVEAHPDELLEPVVERSRADGVDAVPGDPGLHLTVDRARRRDRLSGKYRLIERWDTPDRSAICPGVGIRFPSAKRAIAASSTALRLRSRRATRPSTGICAGA